MNKENSRFKKNIINLLNKSKVKFSQNNSFYGTKINKRVDYWNLDCPVFSVSQCCLIQIA